MRKPPAKSRHSSPAGARGRDEGYRGATPGFAAARTAPAPAGRRDHLLYGVHPVTAAWLNPERKCRHLYGLAHALAEFRPILERAPALGLSRPLPTVLERDGLDRLLPAGAVHQGLALDAAPLPEVNLEDVLIQAGEGPATLVLLDQVTDPHNVGAILRSAAAFGAAGLIVQTRHAPEITGVLAKSASGAVEIVPILRETNLARAVVRLREAGFVAVALDERGEPLGQAALGERVVLALGAEGVGLRRLIAESCDLIASLPTVPPIGSLNVSNAAAVGLYEIVRRRGLPG
jgi:23S rRNA (guanosine2251-2'-O)-methyltransferase